MPKHLADFVLDRLLCWSLMLRVRFTNQRSSTLACFASIFRADLRSPPIELGDKCLEVGRPGAPDRNGSATGRKSLAFRVPSKAP